MHYKKISHKFQFLKLVSNVSAKFRALNSLREALLSQKRLMQINLLQIRIEQSHANSSRCQSVNLQYHSQVTQILQQNCAFNRKISKSFFILPLDPTIFVLICLFHSQQSIQEVPNAFGKRKKRHSVNLSSQQNEWAMQLNTTDTHLMPIMQNLAQV